jgi:hypothetical protein
MDKTDSRPIGLTLPPADYARLQRFADDHHWSLARASRVIVLRALDAYDTQQEGTGNASR